MNVARQGALPFVGVTRCGYCDRQLVQTEAGNWECPRCAPLLAEVTTVEDWRWFAKRADRDRVAVDVPTGVAL